MKPRRTTFITLVVSLSMLVTFLPGNVMPSMAQGPQPPMPLPPQPPLPPEDALWKVTPDGHRYMPVDAPRHTPADTFAPQMTGGPDDYGYTWNDSVLFGWIDAVTGGTDTGMSGSAWNVGPVQVALPFPFKYYENTYTSVYINAAGFVGFTSSRSDWQSSIPNPAEPNNVIAPYWSQDIYLNSTGLHGRVYYKNGGIAPNRYLVVEWYDVKGGDPTDTVGNDDTFRFEVVLYENNTFDFQYQAMTYVGYYWCYNGAGIEDSTGLDGLMYLDGYYMCDSAPSNKAVHFTRPAAAARVSVNPRSAGAFSAPGRLIQFNYVIRNTGNLGADTYDLFTSSVWPVSLYAEDGTTPLIDTDGDSFVDTGPVGQGGTFTGVAKVQTPGAAGVGDNDIVSLTVQSSLNTSKSKSLILRSAVPAPFAQVFNDRTDSAMSVYLVQPAGQSLKKATEDGHYGFNMAVAEMPNGNFAYAWSKYRSLGSVGVYEIEYTLVNHFGETVRAVSKLTNNTGATVNTYDYPAIAVDPNGRVGVLWYRYLYNNTNGQFNYNLYFAVLDASGSLVYGPANLTNNTLWGTSSTLNVPQFYDQRITATGDNRFVLAWSKFYYGAPTGNCSSYCSVSDIYYAVRDSNGNQVKTPTAFTHDTAGYDDYYFEPALASLSGNRALLAFSREASYQDIYYAVLDSSGNTIKGMTNLSADGSSQYDRGPDAVQLSNGKVVVAWSGGTYPDYRIRFAVLDIAYNRIAGPTTLDNSAAVRGDDYVSVSADTSGHAILTWMDYESNYRPNLYYALVDGNGTQTTPPMIFHTSQGDYPYVDTSYEGYGNASYSWAPPSSVDGVITLSSPLIGGTPGGIANVAVTYINHGATIATSVVLTATLDPNLTYAGDTLGIAPVIAGNNVVWNLPDMALYEGGRFMLRVNVPSVAIGTRYPVTLTLASAGPEANVADNTASTEVMVARQLYLSLIRR